MLKRPMIDKLLAMRLHGMAESLKAQEQDPAARELSFSESLGLLVDQQWNWRENQALSRRMKNAKLRTPNACVEDRLRSAIRHLLMASLSAWSTTHIELRCGEIRCATIEQNQMRSPRRSGRESLAHARYLGVTLIPVRVDSAAPYGIGQSIEALGGTGAGVLQRKRHNLQCRNSR
jgi:hypothetical protein